MKDLNKILEKNGMTLERYKEIVLRNIDDMTNLPPEYIIGEAKYGTSSLTKNLADGTNQMDDNWIAIRMENAVGAEMYEKYLTDIILYPSCRKDILFHINSDCTVGEPIMLIDGIPRR